LAGFQWHLIDATKEWLSFQSAASLISLRRGEGLVNGWLAIFQSVRGHSLYRQSSPTLARERRGLLRYLSTRRRLYLNAYAPNGNQNVTLGCLSIHSLERGVQREYHSRFSGAIERWLDAGHGSCVRRNPTKARLHAGEVVLYESELAKGIE
jgi:hypothetical protein